MLAVGAATFAFTAPAQGLDAANTGGPDVSGFPLYYTDNSGLSLELCVDGSAFCGGATRTDDGAGGPGVDAAPDGEGFYWMASSALNSTRGSLDLIEFAHEAAWVDVGQPMVFDRTRIRGDMQPGRYTLLTPYGRMRFTAEGTGARNVNVTQDLICGLGAGGTCAPKMTNWLRSTSAPTGYLGDSVSPTTVTGGPLRNELVLLNAQGNVIGRTRQFTVMGKLAAGPAAALSTDAVDFGNTRAPRQRSVVVNNLGDAPLTLDNVRVAGANTIAVAPTGCAARASLASGGSCRVNLVYTPGARKVSNATLILNDNTIAGVHRLTATAQTAAVTQAKRRVHFTPFKVGTSSRARRVIVENTGVVPMKIRSVSLSSNAHFKKMTGRGPLCAKGVTLRPGRVCATYVGFRPRSFGQKTSTLRIASNAVNSPFTVNLNGRGR